ncbi:hypothetical protein N7486_005872 [Penicillium sp. IBT 16267x]|nr:hypothetical protein N7486_005872 [Penicillium sp. IBT 16267x]
MPSSDERKPGAFPRGADTEIGAQEANTAHQIESGVSLVLYAPSCAVTSINNLLLTITISSRLNVYPFGVGR